MALVALAAAACVLLVAVPAAHAATFNPALVISDDSFRAYDSMSVADIQAFLNTQPGVLKTLKTPDYRGKRKSAALIVWEACQHSHVSPKVMLTMLQKEQSLLTRKTLVTGYSATLDWAIGMGCPDSKPRLEKYRGFGKQVWYGAWSLDAYGEAGKARPSGYVEPGWKPGSKMTVYSPKGSVSLAIQNVASFKLYTYNPSIGAVAPYGDLSSQHDNLSGNADFWWIYRSNFGDPRGDPAVRPVYRFVDRKTGMYFHTASYAERYSMQTHQSRQWSFQGVAFQWRTTTTRTKTQPPINDVPVVRLLNIKTGAWVYTSSTARVRRLTAGKSAPWRYKGVAWRISTQPKGTTAVYSFVYKKSGSYLYTSVPRERRRLAADKNYALTGFSYVAQSRRSPSRLVAVVELRPLDVAGLRL
jgi:hypothetical protein